MDVSRVSTLPHHNLYSVCKRSVFVCNSTPEGESKHMFWSTHSRNAHIFVYHSLHVVYSMVLHENDGSCCSVHIVFPIIYQILVIVLCVVCRSGHFDKPVWDQELIMMNVVLFANVKSIPTSQFST